MNEHMRMNWKAGLILTMISDYVAQFLGHCQLLVIIKNFDPYINYNDRFSRSNFHPSTCHFFNHSVMEIFVFYI